MDRPGRSRHKARPEDHHVVIALQNVEADLSKARSRIEEMERLGDEAANALEPFAGAHRQNESGAYRDKAVAVTVADPRDPWEVADAALTAWRKARSK